MNTNLNLKWRDFPYWLKSGLLGILIPLLPFGIASLLSLTVFFPFAMSGGSPLWFKPIALIFTILELPMRPVVSIAMSGTHYFLIKFLLIILSYFAIGVLLGFWYKRHKEKGQNNTSQKSQNLL